MKTLTRRTLEGVTSRALTARSGLRGALAVAGYTVVMGSVVGPSWADPPPRFRGVVERVERATVARSWRPGCPVGLEDLRLLTLTHWGFDGRPHVGRLVVHREASEAMVRVFRRLWALRFPIERMELVDAWDADDQRSMAANNTSAFNCREVAGRPGVWSQHAYGLAIDVNPVQNPYVAPGVVSPPAGEAWLDRARPRPGLLRDGDGAVRAFAAAGWRWGGHWQSLKDYQHFSANGR